MACVTACGEIRSVRYCCIVLFTLLASNMVWAEELSQQRRVELQHMLRHDCGSCHGMTLKGGLGPALTAEALAGKPADFLLTTIRDGRPGTPMPPWGELLSEEEIVYLVKVLMEGMPQ